MFHAEAPTEPRTVESPVPDEGRPSSQPISHFETLPSTIPAMPQPGNASSACVEAPNPVAQLADPPTSPLPQQPSSSYLYRVSENTNGTPAVANHGNEAPTPSNKHELLIFPDEHSVINDPLLRCTPYIINTNYKVLICTDCKHCVNPNRASEHLRKHHSHCKVGAKFTAEVVAKYPGLINETIQPQDIIQPIFGLAISKKEYMVCARCRRGYVDLPCWRHHACANPDIDLQGTQEHFPSHVQTFFLGPNICYFPVSIPVTTSDNDHRDDFDLFQSAFHDFGVSEDEVGDSEDYRVLNQFLLKEGWLKHVAGYPISELFLLTTPPQENEMLRPIAKDVIALMSDIQTAIGSAGYHVRRLLGKRPS